MQDSAASVPQDLMDELHRANDRLHVARQEVEKWMDASEYRHQERINIAADKLREAEHDVEALDQRIKQALAGRHPPH